MASSPLPILLLIAVAFSQVFGGVSCCCLSRSLFLDWRSSLSNPESNLEHCDSQKPTKRSVAAKALPKCPRCSSTKPARSLAKRATPNPSNSGKPMSGIVCKSDGSEQCQCTKYVAVAELPSWVKSFPLTSLDWSLINGVATETRPSTTRTLNRETSARHSNRVSWQAYACIWTI